MSKVVGAISLSLLVASAGAAWSQGIGTVTALPNAVTGELVADTAVRPGGETVYIVRDGQLVTDAKVKSSSSEGGTVITLPAGTTSKVLVGDAIALTPPAGTTVTTTSQTTKVSTEVGAPEPAVAAVAPASVAGIAVSVPSVAMTQTEVTAPQLDKEAARYTRREVTAAIAEPTPRGMGVPLYPAPARVVTEAGIVAPYGQGLAAAAPVGTPYLRSPAFAGPPIIYMPQTVTRVLLPGATPYPSNIMSPPTAYTYASAPFLRTDIYTSLPYGTFYWPQGYAGTTPVEPQVPAYVTAPASAILSTEADYSVGRYVPGVANEETLNPITAGINSSLVASTTLSSEQGGTAASVAATGVQPTSLTVVQPGAEAVPSAEAIVGTPVPMNPFPVLSDGTATVSATPASVVTPGGTSAPEVAALPNLNTAVAPLVPVAPVVPIVPAVAPVGVVPTAAVAVATPVLPSLPTAATPDGATAALPSLPAGAPAAALPSLPEAAAPGAALPTLPEIGQVVAPAVAPAQPATGLPSLPTTQAAPAQEIIVDDKTPGGLTLDPPAAWTPSVSTQESHQGSSVIAAVDPTQVKTATFNATIPADGTYDVSLWFVSATQFRSNAVPVTVHTATGPQQTTVDQTSQPGAWHTLGTYSLKAGQNVPVVTLSTAGLEGAGNSVSVSADAIRLTPRQ